jgi:lipoprotein-releasing system permease protein
LKFEFFISRRYFSSSRSGGGFVAFIKRIAIGGVALGSAGLLIALMIVHGFKAVIQDKTLEYGPNITIETYGGQRIEQSDTLVTWVKSIEGVADAISVLQGQGMVQSGDFVEGSFIKGVPLQGDLTGIPGFIKTGSFSLEENENGRHGAVIGIRLARSLGIDVGGTITIFAARGLPSTDNQPTIAQFEVRGIYQTGIEQFDDVSVYVHIDQTRRLFDFHAHESSVIEVKVSDPRAISIVNERLNDVIFFPYYAASIYETYGNIFAWINLQEQTIPIIIGVLIIIAAFNLIGAILMMVLERTRDIGILKTMGATDQQIRKIFLYEGILVAVWGLFIGILIALSFFWIQDTWQLIPLSEDNYYMAYAPVQIQAFDFLWVSLITLSLCLMASWLPAGVAARTPLLRVIAFGR